jgi:hypothetical protein
VCDCVRPFRTERYHRPIARPILFWLNKRELKPVLEPSRTTCICERDHDGNDHRNGGVCICRQE